jgi:hypothetical protein
LTLWTSDLQDGKKLGCLQLAWYPIHANLLLYLH